ncbi:MAG TPA: helix-turn-helix domain-containing protein, partial [Thermoanaerobaculia bacterium]|nr:helix-turn-helix domain-containing protein [Thermoanaerobaculia bacterium]
MKKEAPALPGSSLAHNLAVLRTACGFTQQELARAARVHPSSLSEYEGGLRVPKLPTLFRLVEALGVTFSALDLTRSYLEDLEATRRLPSEALAPRSPGHEGDPGEVGTLVAHFRRDSERLLATFCSRMAQAVEDRGGTVESPPLVGGTSSEGDQAEELWALLKRLPSERQRKLLQEDSRFWNRGFCERLCEESEKQAARHPNRAFLLAEHSQFLACKIAGEQGHATALRAYAAAYLANAIRAQGSLPAADEAFEQACRLWSEVAQEGEAPAGYEARILDLKSSFRRDQRRLPEAIELIDQALALEPAVSERGRLLIKKSKILEETGDLTAAIALLREAEPLVDPKADPRLVLCLRHNLMWLLATEGKAEEAQALFPGVQTLARKLNNGLDLVRLRWAEARIQAAFGRTAKAIELLMKVRGEFSTRGIAYDTALVTLELAALLASEGRAADVKTLARHLVPIFKAHAVHRE